LIIRPSALGDVCRSVPVLVTLRAAFPKARIDWLVQDSFAEAVASHPMLSGVVKFPRGAVGLGKLVGSEGRAALVGFLGSLRSPRYDMVVDAQGLGRSGFFAWWTGASRRVGYANAREVGWLGLNRRHRVDANRHAVDRMLALLEMEGLEPVHDMRLYASASDLSSIDPTLRGTRYAVIAPTSRWEGKRWAGERFAEVTKRLLESGRVDYAVVVASGSELGQCAPVLALQKSQPRLMNQVGRTTVGELMALISQSALVLANDSAALHMAVGFDRPLVGLFGPTRVDLVGPYRRGQDVIQAEAPKRGVSHKDAGAGRAMMDAIGMEVVVKACLERLGPFDSA
jgi:ADP-heptose:LPS heptosyltransferase